MDGLAAASWSAIGGDDDQVASQSKKHSLSSNVT